MSILGLGMRNESQDDRSDDDRFNGGRSSRGHSQ